MAKRSRNSSLCELDSRGMGSGYATVLPFPATDAGYIHLRHPFLDLLPEYTKDTVRIGDYACRRRALEKTAAQVPAGSPTWGATSRHFIPNMRNSMILDTFSGVTLRGRPGGRPDLVARLPSLISRMATRTLSDRLRDSNDAITGRIARRRSLPMFGVPSSDESSIGSRSEWNRIPSASRPSILPTA